MSPPKTLKRGFSLIEAAIVLGIVGIVIGGIWAAMAAVRARLDQKTVLELAAQINTDVKKYSKTLPGTPYFSYINIYANQLPPGFTPGMNWGWDACGHGVQLSMVVEGQDADYGVSYSFSVTFGDDCGTEHGPNTVVPKPQLCVALARMFVQDPNLVDIQIFNGGLWWKEMWGGPRPTGDEIITACATGTSVGVSFKM